MVERCIFLKITYAEDIAYSSTPTLDNHLPLNILKTLFDHLTLNCIPLLQAELEEIESRVETYPETRAFMTLLASLTQYPVPSNLGAGYRAPGFEPYLDFLRDSVLLKFKARAYLDPNEKVKYCLWQVNQRAKLHLTR